MFCKRAPEADISSQQSANLAFILKIMIDTLRRNRQDLDQLHIYCRKLWNKVSNRGAVAFPWCSWCRELWRSASSSSAETPGSSQPGGCCRPALPQSSWHDQRPQPDTEPEHDRWPLETLQSHKHNFPSWTNTVILKIKSLKSAHTKYLAVKIYFEK